MKYIFARSTQLGTRNWAFIRPESERSGAQNVNFSDYITAHNAKIRLTTPKEKELLKVNFVAEVNFKDLSFNFINNSRLPESAIEPSLVNHVLETLDVFEGGAGMLVDLYCFKDGSFKIRIIEKEENQQYSETIPQPKRIPFTGEIVGQFGDNTILKQGRNYYMMDCYGDVSKITLPID